MLKIGEFACLARVSIATLRHYDEYGLLKPAALDPLTGYRYYSLAQLPRLHRIVALKELGFPLSQIARLLEDSLSPEHLQELFQFKQAHIQRTIEQEQERLARVAARLQQIKQEGNMPAHEIVLKQVEDFLIAYKRRRISLGEELAPEYRKIVVSLEEAGIKHSQPHLLLWHSRFEVREEGVSADVELAVPVSSALPGNELIATRILPAGLVASTIHPAGSSRSLGQAYTALTRWLAENRYRLVGSPRQVHLQHVNLATFSPAVAEIQFPVEKLGA